MHKIISLAISMGILASACNGSPLSTTKSGDFQAIAQSPYTISLYWKSSSESVSIYQNGELQGTYENREPNRFNASTVSALTPATTYTFQLGETGPQISERTWNELPAESKVDVLVIGGTASGVAAAVTAAELGLSVALVENTNRLGGMSSNGLASTDIRKESRSNGFFNDFRLRIIGFYSGGNGLRYEPRVANAIIKNMLYEHPNISIYLRTIAICPLKCGNRVSGAVVEDTSTRRSGKILASMTIDATDTGDFAAASSAAFRVGREGRSAQEPHAGVIYFDDSTQQILPGSTGAPDSKQQSYAYLMIWKDYGDQSAPLIDKPEFYDPANYQYSPDWKQTWNYTSGRLPNKKYEINQHPFGIDWPGINYDYPNASCKRRSQIEAMYRARALGYLYFMQNERGHRNLGLADDEFLDNANFPPALYVREARRIEGKCILTESDITHASNTFRLDSIGIGDYPMDSHATEDLKDPSVQHKGEGEMWLVSVTPVYQIPYGVLVPKGVDGLLVSTAVSGTHVGYGTLRMEPVRMSLGQAAATAAYWSILYGIDPNRVNPAWIQDKILSQRAYVSWNSDVNPDTRHFKAINFLGACGVFTGEEFRPHIPISYAEAISAIERMAELEGICVQFNTDTPNDPISRGKFAEMLVAAKQKTSRYWSCAVPKTASYTDVSPDSRYYAVVEILRANRIKSDLFENSSFEEFHPDDLISRADAAEVIFLAHRPYAMTCWMPLQR